MELIPSGKRKIEIDFAPNKITRTGDHSINTQMGTPSSSNQPIVEPTGARVVSTTWHSLPEELHRIILAHVTPDDISNWGKVCPQWLGYTKSKSFWRLLWRQQGGPFGQMDLPDRMFASKHAGQMLRTIYTKNLLRRNFVTNHPNTDLSLHWNLGPEVTHRDDFGLSKRTFLIPPGSKVNQDITLRQHGVYPTLLRKLGPMQFVTSAKFRSQAGTISWGDIIMLGVSQIGHGRMARFERLANIETDSDGWKTAEIQFETLGLSFKTASQNKLLLHIANMASSAFAVEVADISIMLKIVAVETSPKKPDFGYGFKDSMFRSMDTPEI